MFIKIGINGLDNCGDLEFFSTACISKGKATALEAVLNPIKYGGINSFQFF